MKKFVRTAALALAAVLMLLAGSARASSSVVCNGDTYTWPDQFQGYGYVTYFPLLINDCNAQIASSVSTAQTAQTAAQAAAVTATTSAATQGTSTTSLTIGTGAQSLTIQTGKGFLAGMPVRIASTASPGTAYMDGVISAYTSATGSLTVTVNTVTGSGTLASWNVFMSGPATLPTLAAGDVLGNAGSGSATATDTTLTALIDKAFGSTQGNILYRGASNWGVLAPGAANQVLQTGGAGANPSWATPARQLLGSQSGSGVSALTFSNVVNGANEVNLECHGLLPASNATLYIQVGTGAGPTWITSGYVAQSVYGQSATLAGALNSSVAGMVMDAASGIASNSTMPLFASEKITNLQNTQGSMIGFIGQSGYMPLSSGAFYEESHAGNVPSGGAAITSVRVIPSTGTFSGACALYSLSGA